MAATIVTVWSMRVNAPSPARLDRWTSLLDASERVQAERFRADHDRHTYIAAHALTRALLSWFDGRPPQAWAFTQTERGKPQVVGGPQFNLSHTGGMAACAVAQDAPLGIDIERRDRRNAQTGLAEAVLASSEHSLLRSLPQDRQQEGFLRFWTLREAYVKATGQGISYPREDFAFTLDPPEIRFEREGAPEDWQFFSWDEAHHIVSLAVNCRRKNPVTLIKRTLDEDDLP